MPGRCRTVPRCPGPAQTWRSSSAPDILTCAAGADVLNPSGLGLCSHAARMSHEIACAVPRPVISLPSSPFRCLHRGFCSALVPSALAAVASTCASTGDNYGPHHRRACYALTTEPTIRMITPPPPRPSPNNDPLASASARPPRPPYPPPHPTLAVPVPRANVRGAIAICPPALCTAAHPSPASGDL